jgi:hypothetical protein
MTMLNIAEAYAYYDKHINREDRFRLLRKHQLRIPGSIHPIDWELFGSILTGDQGRQGYGSDLSEHEVKSAAIGSSFEYQYHLNGGMKKLQEDKIIQHIFISYSTDYQEVLVRMLPGYILADVFSAWQPLLEENYQGLFRRQRFRRSIAYGTVMAKGQLVMHIRAGLLVSTT